MQLRILTYNIHKGIGGLDRRYRLERVAEVIAHYAPDVVCLQEVAHQGARIQNERQEERLGAALGFRHRTWFPNHRFKSGLEYGNAILSRFPITHTENIDLSIPGSKRRSVLHARLRVRLSGQRGRHIRTLHVYNMHLGLTERLRKLQLARFLESHPFAHLDPRAPIVVAGDFNDVWGSLGRKLLVPAGFRGMPTPIRTFPAWAPMRALDALYVRGDLDFEGVHSSRLEVARQASDHLPLVSEVGIHRGSR